MICSSKINTFFRLVIHLDDYTDRGHEWRFYEQAEIIDYDDWKSDDILALPPNLQFRKFQGRFGNTDEIGCDIIGPLFGVLFFSYSQNIDHVIRIRLFCGYFKSFGVSKCLMLNFKRK